MSLTDRQARRLIESEGDRSEIEIETVREVGTDPRNYRVLETDAEDEENQVGFEIAVPDVPQAQTMFKKRLSQNMDALVEYVTGEAPETDEERQFEPETETESEMTEDDGTGDQSEPSSSHVTVDNGDTVEGPALQTSVQVDIDDSLEEFALELGAVVDEAIEYERDVAELEERINDLDARLSKIESTFEALGGSDD